MTEVRIVGDLGVEQIEQQVRRPAIAAWDGVGGVLLLHIVNGASRNRLTVDERRERGFAQRGGAGGSVGRRISARRFGRTTYHEERR